MMTMPSALSTASNRSIDIDPSHQESTHTASKHDLTQSDLNDNLKSTENIKGELSISAPTILPESSNVSSSPFNSHQVLHMDAHDDEQFYSFPSSTDYTETVDPFNISDQTNVSQPIPSTSSTISSKADSINTSVVYGADWTNHARPTSHCWFPFTSNDLSIVQSCTYAPCTNLKSPLLHCESCGLTVHSHHLNDLQMTETDSLPHCRPSFVDGKENLSEYDQHFWTHVSVLPKPCMHCQRTSLALILIDDGINQLSTMSALDIAGHFTSIMSSKPGNFIQKVSESSSGLVCLWCSQCYHRSCWERSAAKIEKIQCDYGIFGNIIVRPQWLSRSSESSYGFRAQLPSHATKNNSESNSFQYTPVILFINKRSGGQTGEKIYRELLRKLNPRQVFLLENNDTITQALDIYASLPNIRICVFGGDGTVGWVLSRLAEAYPAGNNPSVGICPLGTGNDLSRVLNWGGEYDSKQLFHTLLQIPQAQQVILDRWKVHLEEFDMTILASPERKDRENEFPFGRRFQSLFKQPPKFVRETNRDSYDKYHELPNTRFINYMSFGLDAAIALDFHDQRTRDPSKFSSPWKNKLMYLNESCKYLDEFARANMWNLGSYVRLICDGHDLTDAIRDCHTLVVLNIPGYASGTNPWGNSPTMISGDSFGYDMVCSSTTSISTDQFDRQDFGDRKIEIVGLNTTHMATIHVGFRGNRITQCKELRIELLCPMTAQMDGEPFYLPASVAVNITHAGQVLVLNNESK